MDVLVSKVTSQAMNYAVRYGIGVTAGFAINQTRRIWAAAPKSTVRDELSRQQLKLEHKIRIIAPAIDLIELIAARGNTSLETAVALVKELRIDIQILGQRNAKVAEKTEKLDRRKLPEATREQHEVEMKVCILEIKALLGRIEDAVPLINLAITTSGASLSTNLPQTVSPSRLLQASTFLTAGDTQYTLSPDGAVQIGPTFTLTIYMLFAGHNRPQDEEELRETTWKEVIHKAKVKLRRVPLDVVVGTGSGLGATPSKAISVLQLSPTERDRTPSIRAASRADEYAYQLMIVEDFDDDRMHDFSEETQDQPLPGPFDDVALAGIREMIPVHEISKIFYADTSKVLNIGTDAESNHPVLLLKRDLHAVPPRRMWQRETSYEDIDGEGHDHDQQGGQTYSHADHINHDQDPWRFPPSLDPEWIAFEVYTEPEPDSEDSDFEEPSKLPASPPQTTSSELSSSLNNMHLTPNPHFHRAPPPLYSPHPRSSQSSPPWKNLMLTSLSLLELLLRLTSLQQFQQSSHLSITDELLTFFLEESAATGAGGDEKYRQRVRAEARRRVGWDPYDESPVKRRGEDYQYGYNRQDEVEGEWDEREGWSPADVRRDRDTRSPSLANSVAAGRSASQREKGSTTGIMSPSPSPSSIPTDPGSSSSGNRAAWLRRQSDNSAMGRKGSPLRPRPSTAHTDEGIGTSPASGLDGKL
jgi:hypothetical protein